jgi:peptidoglycan/LPS O-acetylase OafA/YrhL
MSIRYRPEIEGLRAVAVVPVVLFHMGMPGFTGGFVGVDVFFVISGYLITSLIDRDIALGRFSLLGFYDRRIRRILPALLTVIVATLVAGFWLLGPDDYAATGASGAAAAASVANFYFYWNTGYFDGPAALMPLLHTWSLAVEEQFYLVWPALLTGLTFVARRRQSRVIAMLAALASASLIASIVQVQTNPKGAFYLPWPRAWELAIGALLALAPSCELGPVVRTAIGVAGLAAIGVATATFDDGTAFPGLTALAPTLGAAAVIWASQASTGVGRVLASGPLTFIGRISYSLYLWHWVLFVLWRHYLSGAALPLRDGLWLASGAVLLATVSWRWVEQPFRRGPSASRIRTVAAGVAAAAVVVAAGSALAYRRGVPERLGAAAQRLADRTIMWDWPCPDSRDIGLEGPTCIVGARWDSAATRAVLWGDSHAEHYAPLFDVAGREKQTAIALYRSCPAFVHAGGVRRFIDNEPGYNDACERERTLMLRFLGVHPEIREVLVAANWSYMPDQIYRTSPDERATATGLELLTSGLDELLRALDGRRVVLLGDVPHVGYEPIPCVLRRDSLLLRRPCDQDPSVIPRGDYDRRQGATDAILREAGTRPGATTLIPGDALCDARGCSTYLNGEFLYRDEHHLRRNLMPETVGLLARRLNLARVLHGSN